MRLWSPNIMPYLPELQFKGQLRELIAVMHDWRDKGTTNHILVNRVMLYSKSDLCCYAYYYFRQYKRRYNIDLWSKYKTEFVAFAGSNVSLLFPYSDWLNSKTHLRIEMANLYEKHIGIGKSRISDQDWQTLLTGYRAITGETYNL